jgi:hypothetical protein
MALETGTYISDLVSTNPAAGDAKAQGDDHLRLIKSTLLATFTGISGAVTATHTQINQLVSGFTEKFGYQTGAGVGGTVTQLTSKSTAVTLNKLSGQITMNNAALASGAVVSFTLTNSTIAATDVLAINIVASTAGSYVVNANCLSGSATITLSNISTGSLSEAVQLRYVVMRGATD